MSIYCEKFSVDKANVLPSGKAAVALAAGDLVYLTSSGTWALAVSTAAGSTDAQGIMPRAALQYETVSPVRCAQIIGAPTGTIGAKAYLTTTGTTGNTIQATKPTGVAAQCIGFYRAATEIEVWVKEHSFQETAEVLTVNKTITSAQLLALNATPIEVIAAPGANKAIIVEDVIMSKAAGTAYSGIAAGEDLEVGYVTGGTTLATIETTGFLDQTTAQCRVSSKTVPGIAVTTNLTPTANAAVVVRLASGEITTGDSDLKLRVRYRVIDTVL
jgi:hypothetical protein